MVMVMIMMIMMIMSGDDDDDAEWCRNHTNYQKHNTQYHRFLSHYDDVVLPATLSLTWISFNSAWMSNYIHYKV